VNLESIYNYRTILAVATAVVKVLAQTLAGLATGQETAGPAGQDCAEILSSFYV
jgi:hypothetical protein